MPFHVFDGDEAHFSAQQIFVNRGDERELFARTLAEHEQAVAAGRCDPADRFAPRCNMLVFYGVGGYGKTRLSRELERELLAGAPARGRRKGRARPEVITARIDLESGWDFEATLLGVRAELAPLAVSMPAFDIVFAKYWLVRHPHLPLGDYVARHKMLNQVGAAAKLPDQIDTALQTAAGMLGIVGVAGSAAWALFSKLGEVVRDHKQKRDAITRCPRFPELLDQVSEPEAVSAFPQLLAWELDHYRQARPLTFVMFIDGFEMLRDRNLELERYIQRMIWLMPNVLFVVTGRDKLDWGKLQLPRELDVVGPVHWPGLAAGSPDERQDMVERLSDADADLFLQGRLRVPLHDGESEPLIPEEIRRVIVDAADGWPEHLGLAVTRFADMTRLGQTPASVDFADGFGELVRRICLGLDSLEQEVLRAASLLNGFDVALVAAAANVSEGAATSLANRSLVSHDPDGFWPYYMSDGVRRQVRFADALPRSWSENDWRRAAARAVAALGERYDRLGSGVDRVELINYLNDGLRLAHEFDLALDWITDAACAYVEDYLWEPTLQPDVPDAAVAEEISTSAQALALALIAIRARQTTHRADTREKLASCLEANRLTGAAEDLVAYFHAESLRDLGLPGESERAMARLVGEGRPMHLQASEGVIYAQRRSGRLAAAWDGLEQLPLTPLRERLRGDLLWNEACFDASEAAYASSRDLALERGLIGHAAEAEASRAFALGFAGAAAVQTSIEEARKLLGAARIKWADLQVVNAELLMLAGDGDFAARHRSAVTAGKEAGLSSIVAYAELAGAFDAAIRGDRDGVVTARLRLGDIETEDQFHYLIEIVDFWHLGAEETVSRTDWPAGVETTAARWRAILEARRRRARSDPCAPPTPPNRR